MDQDEVIKNLRSCLISCKGGIRLDNLNADYHILTGDPLPFKKFGFPTIEAFVYNIPDITVTNKNGELYVEAKPSRTTAHLTKLISRQVSRQRSHRKSRQGKKWSPSRYTTKGYSPNFKNNRPQSPKNNQESFSSFTRSTPGKSNLYIDFSRPMPLMENIVQRPLVCNNEKPKFAMGISQVSPSKKLKEKKSPNVLTLTESINKSKTTEDLKNEVLIEKTLPPVIIPKPKTVEPKLPKLSERLKITSNMPPSTSIYNNSHICSSTISNISRMVDISDPRKELEVRANALNLSPPIYKTYTKTEKDSTKTVTYANVKIGIHTFHTFPEDANSKEEAERIAARLALINLAKESSSPEVMTFDTKLIKERIFNIITKHHSGVFMHQLPAYYNEQYEEALPHDWQKIIERCPDINKEKGVGNSTILCRSIETLTPENISPSKGIYSESSLSSEKIQLNPIGPAVPNKLKVPEALFWNVYTTCVISTVEVWVRLIDNDYNDNFIDMMNEMMEYYNQLKEPIPMAECIVGNFYTVFEDSNWCRVQCIDFESNTGIATVHFIDEGYEDQYKYNMLHPLEKKFCVLPVQAIRVALHNLEDFRDCVQIITEIESHLLDQVFCVKVHDTNIDENDSYVTVTFYDTSGKDDIDLNEVLFHKILDNIIAASKVQAGQLVQMYIMHIEEHGKVYAQLNSPIKTCLLKLLNDETMSQIPINILMNSLVKAIDFTKMYFVQLDSKWYRARVTDICNNHEIIVFLVDIGRTVMAKRGNLLHMDKISKVLQNIPPQAVQIFLHNIDQSMYDEKFMTRFNELVSNTDLLLAKVIKVTVSGVPIVEIFKRIGPNNILASINTSLIYDEELTKSNEDNNNNIKPKKRLERKNSCVIENSGKLNPPTISDIGQYFDVHVTLAAHPGHFIIQPLNDMGDLKVMMLELKKCCDTYKGPKLESISEGKLYAGKFMDSYWYRVYVTNIISDNMVSIYFCDYGDVTIVPRSSLQPLKSEFLQLPYQAVKAKLVGIQPVSTDWSVEDCVRFQDLVLGKNFVSIVVESTFDHFSPANGTVLGLRLIDVSTDLDIFIDTLLVQENRAKFIKYENLPSS